MIGRRIFLARVGEKTRNNEKKEKIIRVSLADDVRRNINGVNAIHKYAYWVDFV